MKIHISEDMGADLNLSAFCGDEDDPQVPLGGSGCAKSGSKTDNCMCRVRFPANAPDKAFPF
jgi:hypothetical protein